MSEEKEKDNQITSLIVGKFTGLGLIL